MRQILNIDGTVIKGATEPKVSNKELKKWYDVMVQVRILDGKGMRLQRQGKVGFHIPTTGQEAHVGIVAAMKDSDWVFPAYREHGVAIYRGLDLRDIINHYFANDLDYMTKGRRLPGLFGDKSINFVNPSAPIGTQIIHAAGTGYACKYLGDNGVTAVFFGDGATSSSDFHSGMNFGGVFKTPTLFVCMNNQYAISVPVSHQTAGNIVDKSIGYGIPGEQVDGNDILAMYAAAKEAVARARAGDGPTFIEAITYRLGPHTSSDDPTKYRTKKEVEEAEKRDPILRFKKYLMSKNLLTEKEDKELHDKYDKMLNEYIDEAEARPKPKIDTMFEDVFSDIPWHLKEQLEEVKRFHKGA